MRTDKRTDGETDRHDEANSRFSHFCEKARDTCARNTDKESHTKSF